VDNVTYKIIWETAINSPGSGSFNPTDETIRHPELINPSIETTDTERARIHIAKNTAINIHPKITPMGAPSHWYGSIAFVDIMIISNPFSDMLVIASPSVIVGSGVTLVVITPTSAPHPVVSQAR